MHEVANVHRELFAENADLYGEDVRIKIERCLSVSDADAAWARALRAGATVFEPIHDAFWGDRTGQVLDPFGHRGALDQHVRDVPHDEIVRRAALSSVRCR